MAQTELMSRHPVSGRTAIIDRSGDALWFYLTDRESLSPQADCWLVNLDSSEQDLAAFREAGLPPPAPLAVVDDSIPAAPDSLDRYRLEWSEDGEAVQALADDRTVAFIVAGYKQGFHLVLRVDCPWGNTFDAELHGRLFGSSSSR